MLVGFFVELKCLYYILKGWILNDAVEAVGSHFEGINFFNAPKILPLKIVNGVRNKSQSNTHQELSICHKNTPLWNVIVGICYENLLDEFFGEK